MTPEEIVTILNEHKHDGENDWDCFESDGALVPSEVYFSTAQRVREGTLFMPLSPASANLIAKSYRSLKRAPLN